MKEKEIQAEGRRDKNMETQKEGKQKRKKVKK
jgi:hypothetical protein